jgi:hypothetical protein
LIPRKMEMSSESDAKSLLACLLRICGNELHWRKTIQFPHGQRNIFPTR